MPVLDAPSCALLLIDFQTRLMPAMHEAGASVDNARRLMRAAHLLEVPVLLTEQNPGRLGPTVPDLRAQERPILAKMTFDVTRDPGFEAALPDRPVLVVAGWEAHVCVLQTVLGLREHGRRVAVVEDAVGSRAPQSREAAIRRMTAHGAEAVTTEMVVFEWLGSAGHPHFREAVALIK